MIIVALLALGALTIVLGLTLGRIVYLREAHRLPKISEWQARKNAAPLSHAIVSRTIADE